MRFLLRGNVVYFCIIEYFVRGKPAVKEETQMKAHIARNQNAGVPLALGWNLSAADRGILEGMAPAFGM